MSSSVQYREDDEDDDADRDDDEDRDDREDDDDDVVGGDRTSLQVMLAYLH